LRPALPSFRRRAARAAHRDQPHERKGTWDWDELKVELKELILNDAPLEVSRFAPNEIDPFVVGDDLEVASRET
jgi:hypothetical protein